MPDVNLAELSKQQISCRLNRLKDILNCELSDLKEYEPTMPTQHEVQIHNRANWWRGRNQIIPGVSKMGHSPIDHKIKYYSMLHEEKLNSDKARLKEQQKSTKSNRR